MKNPFRSPRRIAPPSPLREVMAAVALGFTVLGSAVMTLFATWVIWIVWKGGWALDTAQQRISILSKALVISLGGSLIVLITLGFVISRRTIKVSKDGFAMSSDDTSEVSHEIVDDASEDSSATTTIAATSETVVHE